jgi:hypothetical protein
MPLIFLTALRGGRMWDENRGLASINDEAKLFYCLVKKLILKLSGPPR